MIACFVLEANLAAFLVDDVDTLVQALQELVIASPLQLRVNELEADPADRHVKHDAVDDDLDHEERLAEQQFRDLALI